MSEPIDLLAYRRAREQGFVGVDLSEGESGSIVLLCVGDEITPLTPEQAANLGAELLVAAGLPEDDSPPPGGGTPVALVA